MYIYYIPVHLLIVLYLLVGVFLAPCSLEYVNSVQVRDMCHSVCHYDDGQVLVGVRDGVDVIRDGQYQTLIKLAGDVFCVRVHNQHLYLLHSINRKLIVRKHRLNGDFITSWKHDESSLLCSSQFVIHDDILIVPSGSTNSLKRYTESGEPAGADIRVELRIDRIGVCVTPGGHLVLSQSSPSLVVCVNPKTGEQLWSRRRLMEPRGVISDNHAHLLVATRDSNALTVVVLRVDTGETVSQIIHRQTMTSLVCDLHVSAADLLAVPQWKEGKIYLYQLQRGI